MTAPRKLWPSKGGRPRRKPIEGLVALNVRVSAACFQRLAEACRVSGRSQSREAELRLVISLRKEPEL
jgi:hypothetical protein